MSQANPPPCTLPLGWTPPQDLLREKWFENRWMEFSIWWEPTIFFSITSQHLNLVNTNTILMLGVYFKYDLNIIITFDFVWGCNKLYKCMHACIRNLEPSMRREKEAEKHEMRRIPWRKQILNWFLMALLIVLPPGLISSGSFMCFVSPPNVWLREWYCTLRQRHFGCAHSGHVSPSTAQC